MYDICLTVSAWCIIGLLGVLFIILREHNQPFFAYFARSSFTTC